MLSGVPFQRLRLRSEQLQAAVDDLFTRHAFDIVQLETTHLADLRFPPGVSVVVDEHNLEYELFDRMARGDRNPVRRCYYSWEAAKLRRVEKRHWRETDRCLVTSEREAPIVREASGDAGRPAVIPNGVDVDYFQPTPDSEVEPDRIIFTGLMSYRPNVDGLTFLVREILPRVREVRTAAHLMAVGSGVTREVARLAGPAVTVTGAVPDMRPYFSSAAAVAVPLRMGGGTRLKVLEALAMGRPVVSTALGAEGLDVRHNEHLLLADSPSEFAAQLIRVLEDPDLAARLGARGRALVEERYTWAAAGQRLRTLYASLDAAPSGLVTDRRSRAVTSASAKSQIRRR